ncbi:ATP-dependent DNA helicase PIF1 [Paramuricea clavata]|uniref:ATP-dependent DNA helicase n=1 Tax=Paramuricea clavata TaxID=317549 RepID=A0A6S7INZ1_PARCT|nr:ATP-dependent DNA helicase PIF1 [Paramuricea clavata]
MAQEKKQKILENRRVKYEEMDQSKKEELLTKNMNYKETMSKEQKQKILENKRAKYEAMDQSKKEELLTKNMNYKETMGEEQKQKLLENMRGKYQAMDLSKKKELSAMSSSKIMSNRISLDPKQKNNLLNREKEKRMEKKYLTHDIDMCIEKFKKQIKSGQFYICCVCNRTLYKKSVVILQKNKYPRQDCFVLQCSFDGKNYICKTCHAKLLKGQQPCQAVVNNLFVDETPTELAALEKLEQILVAQRIVFEKIVIKDNKEKLKVQYVIPPDRSGIILLKLKRKLQFRGHVYFQAVRPQFVISALNWLVANNPLYRNIEIQCDNISPELTNLNCPVTDQENIDEHLQTNVNRELLNEDAEEQDDPLNEHRSAATETCLQSILPNYPVNLDNRNCDNSTGREIFNIAPGEVGNLQPIQSIYSFIMEQKKISDRIKIALKKIHGQSVTASQVKSNSQAFQNLLLQDQAYLFLRQIPGSPPYWQKFMYEVVAMVKQLGIPTWFMTLSCADLRWPELFQIIAKTKGNNMTDEEVDALSYHERCSMLNLNPVIVAKHFQYRVETFFRDVLLTNANPIGKIVYYALRIEFQMRDKETDPQLYDLVKTYQTHNHSKTCRKYKNVACRFNFGQFFTDRTIVAEPLAEDMDDEIKSNILTRRKEILSKVKQKIDDVLNPSKPTYDPHATPTDILNDIDITEQDYQWAISLSPDSDYELHLKRPIDSCFINNYFIAGLKGFAANVDLQPVFNHYKCVTYVCSYFTKDETECSQAIINAAKEAKEANLNVRDGLRKVVRTTDFAENRVRFAKKQQELDELGDDSTDIFKSNIIVRYSNRPKNIPVVNDMCLALFASHYFKDYKSDFNEVSDSQPEVLSDDFMESQNIENHNTGLPDRIKLVNSKEIMKCRKIKAVIRYHTPNKRKEPEKYFHHLLMLYFPWRNEQELFGEDQTYISKFYEPDVQEVVQCNKEIFEPDGDAINEALESLRNFDGVPTHSYDPINDQENEDLRQSLPDDSDEIESFNESLPQHLASIPESVQPPSGISSYNQPLAISDDNLRKTVRSLNNKQRYAYDVVLSWCRNKMANLNTLKPSKVDPIHVFVTGGGGAGKSHLIKAIYHTVTKTFRHAPMNPELPSVLLMAPTGVAAININGTTVNTALAIPRECGNNVPAMSDQRRTQMRLSLAELKLIIIDEISMVSNMGLLHIHQRLKEIFVTPNSELFAGISVLVFGDFFQLPPIGSATTFSNYKIDTFNLHHSWHGMSLKTITPDDENYPSDALHIFAENAPVDEYNIDRLQQIQSPQYVLEALDQFPPHVRKQDVERVLSKGRSETGGLDTKILIKENARIMLTTNVDISDRLINGQLGTVIRVYVDNVSNKPSTVFVKFDDCNAGISAIQNSSSSFARENNLVPIKPVLARIKVRPGKPSSPEMQRLQFPVTLAWACTVHKVQGLTLDNIVVSFDLKKQRYFNYGQVYVALSRATSLNGLHILGKLESKHIRANPKVQEEYERLRETSSLHPHITTDLCNIETVSICLLNIRSFKKHSLDLCNDPILSKCDVLALTETQLLTSVRNDDIINSILNDFSIHRQDHNSDKFLSLAVCYKDTITLCDTEYFTSINGLRFLLNNSGGITLSCLLLYRKHGGDIQQFIACLHYIITSLDIDVIFGDFNIDYFNDNNSSITPYSGGSN